MAYRLNAALAAACIVAFAVSLMIGPVTLSPSEALRALLVEPATTPNAIIMREIRLPRALLAVMIGGSLGLSGAVLQGYLRNPLAEPGVLGISGFASFGAVIAIYTGLYATFPAALPLLAMSAALVAVGLLRLLAGPSALPSTILLAGVALASFSGAMTAAALSFSPNPFALSEIVFWLLGSLADRSMEHVWLALFPILAGWLLLFRLGPSLDALTLGLDAASSLGVSLSRLQVYAVVGTAACVGASTAVAGSIGFVGLVVPHILRRFVGSMPGRLLLPSCLGGAALVLLADVATRVIMPQRDLKIGVLTALIGAPFFLALVYRTRGGHGGS